MSLFHVIVVQETDTCVSISQYFNSRNIKYFNFPIKIVKRTTAFVIISHHISTRKIKIFIKPHDISANNNQIYDDSSSLNCKCHANFHSSTSYHTRKKTIMSLVSNIWKHNRTEQVIRSHRISERKNQISN